MIRSKTFHFIFFSILITLSGYCQTPFNYNLTAPFKSYILPPILEEVSGISYMDQENIACVQDEIGEVFIYSLKEGGIVASYQFEPAGDFEGVAYTANEQIFILRSDGRLTEWKNFRSENGTIKHHQLTLQTRDNEGLCYDPELQQLLIAGKSKPENKAEKHLRFIYAFNLKTGQTKRAPYITIDLIQVQKTAQKMGYNHRELNTKGKPKPFNFSPSALAIHPIESTIFILAAEEYMLLETDRKGNILNIHQLDKSLFQKAEGITFLPDGTLLISNEAGDRQPTLLIYKVMKLY